jgi:hypothetical protein
MTEKYTLLMYYVHSYLESVRDELKITKDTTVENFRNQPENETHCKKVFDHSLTQWNYELSYNQIANGVNLLNFLFIYLQILETTNPTINHKL